MNRRYSLKASVYRTLAIRLALAAIAVGILFASISYTHSYDRIGQGAIQHARNEIEWLRYRVRELVDEDGVPPQQAIETAFYEDPNHEIDRRHGDFIFARIVNDSGSLSAEWVDEGLSAEPGLLKDIQARPRLPVKMNLEPRQLEANLAGHLELQVSIEDRQKQPVSVYAVFRVSEIAKQRVRMDQVMTVAYVFLIVFVTALALYPIILMLLRRVSRYAEDLLDSNLETLQVLGNAIAKKDSDTDAHNYRVTLYSVRLAEAAGLQRETIRSLIKGAFLHDVGKIGIRDNILLKPGRLDNEEFKVMKTHVDHGLDIVARSRWLDDAVAVVGSHHEKFDGSGYPKGVSGAQIPITARIFAIADVFDALSSKRPYKQPLSFEETMQILDQGRGSHFDPELLDQFEHIAKDLYGTVSSRGDEQVRKDLGDIVSSYFKDTAGLAVS